MNRPDEIAALADRLEKLSKVGFGYDINDTDRSVLRKSATELRLAATSPGDAVREAFKFADDTDWAYLLGLLEKNVRSPSDAQTGFWISVLKNAKAALAPAEKAGDDAQARGNALEHHPALARKIERMASTGNTGSLLDWQRFTDALNAALAATPTPPSADVERIRPAIDALTNGQEQCDEDGVMVRVSRQALVEVLAFIQSAAPGGGTEGGEG